MTTFVAAPPLPEEPTIAILGLGYVGLPLAIEFGKHFDTIGFDHASARIAACQQGCDPSGEIEAASFAQARRLRFTTDAASLRSADVLIVAVPTPVDAAHRPDFGPLIAASEAVGRNLKSGALVVYESTVYPGATEEVCVPVLERHSGLRWAGRADAGPTGGQFHIGYSPERINPGEKGRSLTTVVKVVAADDEAHLEYLAGLYGQIVRAGIHRASSIKVAEAAKVIENTQRDLNIALMNELAIIFDRIGIDTQEVLEVAGTKWNFLRFQPGLVGGHCIGVDPYYLTHKAEMLGYHPQVILAGRRINDDMGRFVAQKTVKLLAQQGRPLFGASCNVLGLTFKENCPDLRNSRVPELIAELQSFGLRVAVHDAVASPAAARDEYGIELQPLDALPQADALVVAVAHDAYRSLDPAALNALVRPAGVVVDVKACLPRARIESAGYTVWRL